MRRHRRKNPVDTAQLTNIALLLGGAYIAWKYVLPLFTSIGNAGSAVINSATTGIANLFPGTSSSVQVQGTVLMPDGTTFPASNLTSLGFQTVNGQAQFTFNGSLYALTPQVNGQYQAIAM
jgi:hypothetical protein